MSTDQQVERLERELYHFKEWGRRMQDEMDHRAALRQEMLWALKEIHSAASFDWDTMPEAGRRRFREVVLETADKALSRQRVRVERAG